MHRVARDAVEVFALASEPADVREPVRDVLQFDFLGFGVERSDRFSGVGVDLVVAAAPLCEQLLHASGDGLVPFPVDVAVSIVPVKEPSQRAFQFFR